MDVISGSPLLGRLRKAFSDSFRTPVAKGTTKAAAAARRSEFKNMTIKAVPYFSSSFKLVASSLSLFALSEHGAHKDPKQQQLTLRSKTGMGTKNIEGRFCCVSQFVGTLENP